MDNNIFNDHRSEISGLSNNSVYNNKIVRCSGDFCDYDEEDELKNMSDDPEFNTKAELRKARNRFKKLFLGGSTVENAKKEEIDESLEETDPYSFQDDDLPDMFKSSKLKIPQKSIELARNEIQKIESLDSSERKNILSLIETDINLNSVSDQSLLKWPAPLIHWWWRIGQNKKIISKVPISSGFSIGSSLLGKNNKTRSDFIAPDNDIEKSKIKNIKSKIKRNTNSSDSVDKIASLDSLLNGEVKRRTSKILYDLSENPYTKKTDVKHIGQITSFYQEACVCKKCYVVYRELDYLRAKDARRKLLMKKKKENTADNIEEQKLRDKEIEKKIFAQRKFVSRLSKLKPLLAQDVDKSQVFSLNNDISQITFETNLKVNKTKMGPPRGALPPLPWQLDEYKNSTSSSSFVRNIASKAQELTATLKYEKEIQRGKYQSALNDTNQDFPPSPGKDWENFVNQKYRSRSSGGLGLLPSIKEQKQEEIEVKKVKAKKKFDSERLLHPWQRYLSQLKSGSVKQETESSNEFHEEQSIKSEAKTNLNHHASNLSAFKEKVESKKYENFEKKSSLNKILSSDSSELLKYKSLTNNMKNGHSKFEEVENNVNNSSKFDYSNRNTEAKVSIIENNLKSYSSLDNTETKNIRINRENTELNGNIQVSSKPSFNTNEQDDDDYLDDDDEDDGIGWSPFVIPI